MRKLLWLGAGCLALAVSLLAGQQSQPLKNAVEGNAVAIERGRSNFRINCAYCHGVNAAGGWRGPGLTGNAGLDA